MLNQSPQAFTAEVGSIRESFLLYADPIYLQRNCANLKVTPQATFRVERQSLK